MLLNSRTNNFRVRFEKGWFDKIIEEKYEPFIKKLHTPFPNLQTYIESTIQSITFPQLTAESVEQTLFEDHPVKWKGGKSLKRYLNKSISITFKSVESYLNYWIFWDQFNLFYDLDSKNEFMKNIYVNFLDHNGLDIISIEMKQILINSLSSLELNYSSLTAEFKTFTLELSYNYIDIINNISKLKI